MTYTKTTSQDPLAMRLQSIGWVVGTPAGQLKKGDTLMWNWGETSTIAEVLRETPKMVEVREQAKSGNSFVRKFNKTRLVCVLSDKHTVL